MRRVTSWCFIKHSVFSLVSHFIIHSYLNCCLYHPLCQTPDLVLISSFRHHVQTFKFKMSTVPFFACVLYELMHLHSLPKSSHFMVPCFSQILESNAAAFVHVIPNCSIPGNGWSSFESCYWLGRLAFSPFTLLWVGYDWGRKSFERCWSALHRCSPATSLTANGLRSERSVYAFFILISTRFHLCLGWVLMHPEF